MVNKMLYFGDYYFNEIKFIGICIIFTMGFISGWLIRDYLFEDEN